MSIGLSTGLRALLSSKTVMDMIGHNLANQNTPGYSRQVAILQTTQPVTGPHLLQIGTGVLLQDIFSVRNESLNARIRTERAQIGRYDTEQSMLSQLESILGDLTDNGIAVKMQSLFDAADEAAATPEDAVLRGNVLSSISELSLAFRLRTSGIDDQRTTSLLQAQALVANSNSDLAQVANLNTKISSQYALGVVPNDLLDQRTQLLENLAENLGATALPLKDGTVAVSVAGVTLVSGGSAQQLQSTLDENGRVQLSAGKGGLKIPATYGKLGALVDITADYLPQKLGELDTMARSLILESNRIHARGVPATGPFTQLKSTYGITAATGPDVLSLKLSELGLPFEMKDGKVSIAISNLSTGDVERHELDIDVSADTVQDLVDGLNAIPHLSAFVDGAGRLSLKSGAGYGFDFTRRLDKLPVENGTFGSSSATLVAGEFPAALANGDTLQIAVNGGAAQTVTFNSADFADITHATAEEVAAVIAAQASGVTTNVVDGRVVLSSTATGTSSTLSITDGTGSPAAALGLPLSASGSGSTVNVEVSGLPASAKQDVYTFKPTGDGQIGVTDDLGIEVYDQNGLLLTTLEVGAGYEPGTEIEVTEGVNVKFGPGFVQGSAGQFFDLDIPGDTDTADMLPVFGLNALFQGADASTIEVASGLNGKPSAVSGALVGGPGDGGNFLELSGLASRSLDTLSGETLLHRYNGFAADVGSTAAGAEQALKSSTLVMITLESQRAQESGVNPDEELLNLERYQDAYESAAKYLSVLTDLNDVLLQL